MIPFVADPDFTLYVGDVREVLAGMPAGSVDCCVTSPPYWGLRDYGHDEQIGLESSPEAYVSAMVATFSQVRRVLSDTGTLWLNLGDSYVSVGSGIQGAEGQMASRTVAQVRDRKAVHGDVLRPPSVGGLAVKNLVGIPWRVAFALQADGWYLRADIIWSKPNPMPESVTDRPTKAHEYVFLLTKSAQYAYDADAIKEPAAWERWGDQTVGAGSNPDGWIKPKTKRELLGETDHRMEGLVKQSWKKPPTWEERKAAGATRGNVAFDDNVGAGTQRGVHGEGVSHDLGDGLTRNARSVWTIPTKPYSEAHFAVFPEALPERCIKAGCPEGGTVLDPFMGSGTTALVARRLGRKSVGIELNPEYAQLAATRLQQLSLLAEDVA